MGTIEEKINQYLGMEEQDLNKLMKLLAKKGFFEDDSSLDVFISTLDIAHKQGTIDGLEKLHEELKIGKKEGLIFE